MKKLFDKDAALRFWVNLRALFLPKPLNNAKTGKYLKCVSQDVTEWADFPSMLVYKGQVADLDALKALSNTASKGDVYTLKDTNEERFWTGDSWEYMGEVLTGCVKKTGDTMTGFLTLNTNPTSNLHAATKQYVDKEIKSISTSVTDLDADVSYLKGNIDTLNLTVTELSKNSIITRKNIFIDSTYKDSWQFVITDNFVWIDIANTATVPSAMYLDFSTVFEKYTDGYPPHSYKVIITNKSTEQCKIYFKPDAMLDADTGSTLALNGKGGQTIIIYVNALAKDKMLTYHFTSIDKYPG